MEVIFLGTGTSQGVPMIACGCAVCRSEDPRNRRTRTSIHVVMDGLHVQVDAAPEFRLQCLQNKIPAVDSFILTHGHADHVLGMDDLRRFCDLRGGEALPVHTTTEGAARLTSGAKESCTCALDSGTARVVSWRARNGGTDSAFFESAKGLRGLKQDVYEGGTRVPLVARWPGHIPKGQRTSHPSAFWDMMPTFAELAGVASPKTDGVSFVPSLLGRPAAQTPRDYMYWEFQGRQAVRMKNWKAVRLKPNRAIELYDLTADPAEQTDVAATHPDLVKAAEALFTSSRTESALFPLK